MSRLSRTHQRNLSLLCLLALALGGAILGWEPADASETAMKQDWNQYRGPERNGISSETGWLADWPKSGPTTKWKADIGTGFASMAVVDGKVYALGHSKDQDHVYCLDAETGEVVWEKSYEAAIRDKQHEGGPCGTPAVANGLVFTLGKEGQFYCWNAENGEQVWYHDLTEALDAKIPTWAFSGSPLLYNDWVVIDVGKTAAFKQDTGEMVWKSKDYGSAYSSPVPMTLAGKECIVSFPEFGLVVLDAKDGSEIARHQWETSYGVNSTTPIVDGSNIFISTGYNRGASLVKFDDSGNSETVWENNNMNNHFNTSILHEGYLYGMDDAEKTLACLDYKTGETVWTQDGFGKGSVAFADGKLIILSDQGEMAIAEATPEGYKEISRWQVLGPKCWTVPVISHHKIFARNAKGDLVCIDVAKG
jgi:outer membrane protein assembly factor BamB